jgi:bifunctional non-homologous end joining protein LigD
MPPGAKRAVLPRELQPQFATVAKAPLAGNEWLHEIKYDGYRILAFVSPPPSG